MTIGRRRLGQGIAATAGGLALPWLGARPAEAQRSANALRIAFRDAVPNVDPYFNSQRTGLIIGHQAFDGLVHREPSTFRIVPALATEWRWVDTKTLDFTLRSGVKFHDGSPFGADDVVYTINTIADPATRVATPSNYSWIEGAQKTGDNTVRLTMKRPTPAALAASSIAAVPAILPESNSARVRALITPAMCSTASDPSTSRASPSRSDRLPCTHVTPGSAGCGDRASARTVTPFSCAMRSRWLPTKPVPPVTARVVMGGS